MEAIFDIKKNSSGTIIIRKSFSDTIKLLACLLVAVSHYAQYMIVVGKSNIILDILASQGGYLGVAFFFFFSGYGLICSMSRQKTTFLEYFKKRISKVYIPAVFVSLIWVIILFYLPCLQDEGLGITDKICSKNIITSLLSVFILNFYDSILWFVGVIMVLYVLLFFYDLIKQKNNILAFLFLITSTICVTIAVYYFVAPFASISIFAFAIGVLVCDNGTSIYINRKRFFVASLAVLTALGGGCYLFPILVHGLINYMMLFFFVFLSMCYDIKLKLPYICTSLSYDIYLTHKKILVVLFYIFQNNNVMVFIVIMLVIAFVEQKLRTLIKL